jgi:hypothetical protein
MSVVVPGCLKKIPIPHLELLLNRALKGASCGKFRRQDTGGESDQWQYNEF